jgi:hypothetical protein
MTDRETWFKIVMGQEEVAQLIASIDDRPLFLPPSDFHKSLVFHLNLEIS